MATKDEFFQAMRDKGVSEDAVSVIRKWCRPTLCLNTDGVGTPVGHIGGLPRLPADVEWTIGRDRLDYEPAHWSLVLSLDCAALPHHYLDAGFPESGTLLLFNLEDSGEVVYVPAGVETTERAMPDPEPRKSVYATLHWSRDSFPDYFYASPWETWAKEYFGDDNDLVAAAFREYEECGGEVSALEKAGYIFGQVGGFIGIAGPNHWELAPLPEDGITEDAQDEVAHAEFRRNFPAIAADALQWVLLAAVGNQWFVEEAAKAWYIRAEDLAAGRFDEVVVSYELT